MTKKHNTFSENFVELERIYQEIKDMDDSDLDALVSLYQQGLTLSKKLEQDIHKFEQKINEITLGHISTSSTEDAEKNDDTPTSQLKDIDTDTSTHTISKEYITDLFSEQD